MDNPDTLQIENFTDLVNDMFKDEPVIESKVIDSEEEKKPGDKLKEEEEKSTHRPEDKKEKEEDEEEEEDKILAPTNNSGKKTGRRIELSEVLEKLESFKIRNNALFLTGGLVSNGFTENDIDILVKEPLSAELLHVIKFRLGRMLGPDLASRVSFLPDEFGGPISSSIAIGDFIFEMPKDRKIIRMDFPIAKQKDPLVDEPFKKGPLDSVLQTHFRGKTVHLDWRIKSGKDFLTGWTLISQKPGSVKNDVEDVKESRRLSMGIKPEGNKIFKPFLAPKNLLAEPKPRHPLVWADITGSVFNEGKVGASANKKGVIYLVEKPKVEFGIQNNMFHEYFVMGEAMKGQLRFRKLVSEGERDDAKIPEGEPFWIMNLSREIKPSVLTRRSVREGRMPAKGSSGLPVSVEKDIPKEFQYWKISDQKKAKEVRDSLVDAKIIEEIKIVDNEFRVVHKKSFLGINIRKANDKSLLDFRLIHQLWKGQTVEKVSPSREIWQLLINDPSKKGLMVWQLQVNPLIEDNNIGALLPEEKLVINKDLWNLIGDVKPGTIFNDTKETPSKAQLIDQGNVEIKEESDGLLRISLKGKELKGDFSLMEEEKGSRFWFFTRDSEKKLIKGKVETNQAGIQLFNDGKKNPDRTQLKPLAFYRPLEPTRQFFDIDKAVDEFSVKPILSTGMIIDPKMKGLRTSLQWDGKKVLIFFGEPKNIKDDRSSVLPKLANEVKAFGQTVGPFVLDGELLDFAGKNDDEVLPKKSLSRFVVNAKNQDDSNVKVFISTALFLGDENLTASRHEDVREKVEDAFDKFLEEKTFDHLRLMPMEKVRTKRSLKKAIRDFSKIPGSEGALIKLADSTYSLGGETSSWAKFKSSRTVVASIIGKSVKKGGGWIYEAIIGPVSLEQSEKFKDPVVTDKDVFIPIGKAFSKSVNVDVGDKLEVEVSEVLLDLTGQLAEVSWSSPKVVGAATAPLTTFDELSDMLKPDEVTKFLSKFLPEEVEICKSQDEEERFVLGIVLEPDSIDGQSEFATKKQIRDACHRFMEFFGELGLHHTEDNKDRVRILENFISPADFKVGDREIKKGTWLMALRIVSDSVWKMVNDGELNGLSIFGTARRLVHEEDLTNQEFTKVE